MYEESSPWGTEEDAVVPKARLSLEPTFTPVVSSSAATGWNDDTWGGVDDTSLPALSGNRKEILFNDPMDDSGWGPSSSSLPPIQYQPSTSLPSPPLDFDKTPVFPLPSPSPSTDQHHSTRLSDSPSSTVFPTASTSYLSPPPLTAAVVHDTVVDENKEDDWGSYGEALDLPPVSVVRSRPSSPSTSLRGKGAGWDDPEDSWDRNQVDATLSSRLPTFGSSFNTKVVDQEEEASKVEEGWGGEGRMDWGVGRSEVQEEASQETRRSLGISAAFVDGLKDESRRFSSENYKISSDAFDTTAGTSDRPRPSSLLLNRLLESPLAHSTSSVISAATPTSSLFRLSPTIFPAFQEGLNSTAVKAAQTLKGTSSAAYRNAKFGVARIRSVSQEEQKEEWNPSAIDSASDRGRKGDEFDLDAPEKIAAAAATKSRWWSASNNGSPDLTTKTNTPRGLLATKKEATETVVAPPEATSSSTSSPDPGAPSVLGRFFGRFAKPTSRPSSPLESAEPPTAATIDGQALDDFFGQPTVQQHSPEPEEEGPPTPTKSIDLDRRRQMRNFGDDEFGGLSDSFGAIQSSGVVSATTKRVIPLFDPFGMEEDDVFSSATFISPNVAPSTTILSPQARLPRSSVVRNDEAASGNDFDSFFSSPPIPAPVRQGSSLIAPPPPTSSRTALRSPVTIASTRIASPPSIFSPASSSKGFDLAPPPRSGSAFSISPPPPPHPSSILPKLPVSSSNNTGGLSLADLSFFESM